MFCFEVLRFLLGCGGLFACICVCLSLLCGYLAVYCVIWISGCYGLVVGGCLGVA